MQLKEVFLSVKENIKQKSTNPFFGALIIVWIIHNWEFVYTIFNFESHKTLNNKVSFINDYLYPSVFILNLLECIAITFGVLIATYILLALSKLISDFYKNIITPIVSKVTNKSSIVLKSDYKILEEEKETLIKKIEEERKSKLIYQKEVSNLEEQLKEFLEINNRALDDNIIGSDNNNNNNNIISHKNLSLKIKDDLNTLKEKKNQSEAEKYKADYIEFITSPIYKYFQDIGISIREIQEFPRHTNSIVKEKYIAHDIVGIDNFVNGNYTYKFTQKGEYFWNNFIINLEMNSDEPIDKPFKII